MAKRYWEDFEVGAVIEYGGREVSAADIVAFASRFDPQPMHTDEAAARETQFGGLIASGWHTGSLFMRMMADRLLAETASAGAPGIERLRWTKPVRPGDVLRVRTTVLDKRPSASRPEIGLVNQRHEVFNQAGEMVMWCEGAGMLFRRPGADQVVDQAEPAE